MAIKSYELQHCVYYSTLTDLRSSKLSHPYLPMSVLSWSWSACWVPGSWRSSTDPSGASRMTAAHVQEGAEERNLHLKWVKGPALFTALAEWLLQCWPQPRSAKHSSRDV